MKNLLATSLAAAAASFAFAGPADDVTAAARKISEAANYSWTTTTEIANSQFPATPVEGATEKGGYTVTTRSFNGNTSQTVRKGEQLAMQNRDGEWMTMEELRAQFTGGQGGQGGGNRGGGRGGFGGGMFGGGGTNPADTAAQLAGKLKNLKVEGEAIVGSASGEEAAALLAPAGGRGGRGGQGPRYSTVTVKFWVKDGALAKYELHSVGKITTPDGEEREFESTATTEFKRVGTTKVEVPEAAKKKLGS